MKNVSEDLHPHYLLCFAVFFCCTSCLPVLSARLLSVQVLELGVAEGHQQNWHLVPVDQFNPKASRSSSFVLSPP